MDVIYDFFDRETSPQKMWFKRVKRNPKTLEEVPEQFITQEMCIIAVKACPEILKKVPEQFKEMCENLCPICLSELGVADVVTTVCKHTYHKKCLNKWIEYKKKCPLCRKVFTSLEIVSLFDKADPWVLKYMQKRSEEAELTGFILGIGLNLLFVKMMSSNRRVISSIIWQLLVWVAMWALYIILIYYEQIYTYFHTYNFDIAQNFVEGEIEGFSYFCRFSKGIV